MHLVLSLESVVLSALSQFKDEIIQIIRPIPSTLPEIPLQNAEPQDPSNASNDDMIPAMVSEYQWERYIPHNSHDEEDYYFNKLYKHFNGVNGDNRFQLLKTIKSVIIKDGQKIIFKCARDVVCYQRNLYLEFYSCGYNCKDWVDTYLQNHVLSMAGEAYNSSLPKSKKNMI